MDLHIHILLFVLLSPLLSEGFSLHSRKKKDRTVDLDELVPEELIEDDIAFEEFEQDIEVKEIAIGYLEGAAYICLTVFNFVTAVATQFEFYRKKLEEEESEDGEEGEEHGEEEEEHGEEEEKHEEEGGEHGEEGGEEGHHPKEGHHESSHSYNEAGEHHEESEHHGNELVHYEGKNNKIETGEINKGNSESKKINKLNISTDESKEEDEELVDETPEIMHDKVEDNEIDTDYTVARSLSKRGKRTLRNFFKNWVASKLFKYI